jgi:hypothetical protein
LIDVHSLYDLIELGDIDELLREIDRRSDRRDWQGMLEVRDRCRMAVERGKQLWGVAGHAEYRLALEAPGDLAASVLDSDPGPLVLGPLPEVAASTHDWDELAPHLPEGPLRGLTAYERVARSEDLSAHDDLAVHVSAFELPLSLQDFEPRYSAAEYKADTARFPAPEISALGREQLTESSAETFDDPVRFALLDTVSAWTSTSNGRSAAVSVQGSAFDAIAALDVRDSEAVRISTEDAFALLAWAGASGGAHGRRSGMAAGRSKAWWAVAAIADLTDDGRLPHPEELAVLLRDVQWWTWGPLNHTEGWHLRLAAHDLVDDVAYAVTAHDEV